MESIEDLVDSIVAESVLAGKSYCFLILGTQNSFTSGYYPVSGNEVGYDGHVTVDLFTKYSSAIQKLMVGKGVLCIKVEDGQLQEYPIIKGVNPELFDQDAFELLIFQRYGLEPVEEERKAVLRQSVKAEKIKNTLVFACYLNDREAILARAETARPADLDKVLKYSGTPLQFCSIHNNLEAFRLLAAKGANVGKGSLSMTPLELAFRYSSDIVHYIEARHPAVFEKEVRKKGFQIAMHCRDEDLLEAIRRFGCEMNGEKKPFPPLHNFADYDNEAGLQFLLNHGVHVDSRNQYKQTALHRAVIRGNAVAVDVLLRYGADIHAVDANGQTPFGLAQARKDKTIAAMMG